MRFYTRSRCLLPYVGTLAEAGGKMGDLVVTTGNEIWHDLGRMKATVPYADVVDPSFIAAAK